MVEGNMNIKMIIENGEEGYYIRIRQNKAYMSESLFN